MGDGDGNGKDIYGVLMKMNAEISRIGAKVDRIVDHEYIAKTVNGTRAEWRQDIHDSRREARNERLNDIKDAVTEAKAEIRRDFIASNAEQDRRITEREALIEKTAKSVRLQFMGVMGAAVTMIGFVIVRYLVGWGT